MHLYFFLAPDISIAVIDLLQELTDPDILNENEDTAVVLVDALVNRIATLHIGVCYIYVVVDAVLKINCYHGKRLKRSQVNSSD